MSPDHFFAYARERHRIYIRRFEGVPQALWTDDEILKSYKFTNVFRELDRTTIWFRKNVRDPMRHNPEVYLATVLFRWLNRIESGAAVFTPGHTGPWDYYLRTGDSGVLRSSIIDACGAGPYITGSYIIKTPDGMDKLSGVLWCVDRFRRDFAWEKRAIECIQGKSSLEKEWTALRDATFLGDFMAYELVSDFRHTDLLCDAPDILVWANPGPGARRGLNRIYNRPVAANAGKPQMLREMQDLLAKSQESWYWPPEYPAWEMREVEHTLCEFDKYERVRTGEGKPRSVFRTPKVELA